MKDQKMAHFSHLPPELRNQIYFYLITPSPSMESNDIVCSADDANEELDDGIYSPARPPIEAIAKLAQVNRQIRSDFLLIYHHHCKLSLCFDHSLTSCSSWLRVFGASRVHPHRRVRISIGRISC
ncbi:hypothetical protein DOTSEDRAFT_20713 [Dothistroma septosporum NZE10]|uniref:F-box domain-containing protein n=1 Tax=Dothistroma septosporum (strain NZE10 / CBS 128990) TaxID=675120 RepID=N1Q3I4_DOTSN|nr:hypothetical protein DOTSEDRAFT_20713 [Dothistroma septosporum NZE10]